MASQNTPYVIPQCGKCDSYDNLINNLMTCAHYICNTCFLTLPAQRQDTEVTFKCPTCKHTTITTEQQVIVNYKHFKIKVKECNTPETYIPKPKMPCMITHGIYIFLPDYEENCHADFFQNINPPS